MVTVGITTSASQDGFLELDFGETSSDTLIALCVANVADYSGGLTSMSVRVKNNSGLTMTGRWHVFSYFYDGSSAIISHRSQSTNTVSIADGFDGVKSTTDSGLEIHAGDIIAFQLSKTGTTTGLVSIYTTEDVSGAKYYTLIEIPSTPVAIELATGGLMIYGSGSNYSTGGGIGGTPTQACQDDSETVVKDASSTGLWGLVTPRDFGLSGGDDAAYVDLTFPWATTYAADEIFVDGVTKSYTNDDNPLEHYTLKMSVFRYNDVPDYTRTLVASPDTTTDSTIDSFAILGSYLYALVGESNSVGVTGKVYRTSNGTSWSLVYTGTSGVAGQDMCTHGSALYVLFQDGTLMKSTNGTTYTDVTGTWSGNNAWCIHSFGSYIYCGCWYAGNKVYRSTDGSSWTMVATGLPENPGHFASSSTTLYLIYGSAGYCSHTTDGTTWTTETPTTNMPVRCLAYFGGYLYAGNSAGNSLIRSSDDGATWSVTISTTLSGSVFTSVYSDGTYVWAGNYYTGEFFVLASGTWYEMMDVGSVGIYSTIVWNGSIYVGYGGGVSGYSQIYVLDRYDPVVATGRVYDFHECWWVESSNDDKYVAPSTGSDSNLGFSWDEAFATLQKGLDEVGGGGVVHTKCHTTIHTLTANPSSSKVVKPYVDGSYDKIYITK